MEPSPVLKVSQKLDLMIAIFNREPIRYILNSFTSEQLVAAHQFIWDKLVELHYFTQNEDFNREEVTKNMMSSAAYQHQQGCDLRLDYCKGVECIWSNPLCAGKKVKNNIEVMAMTMINYIDSCSSKKHVQKKSKNHEEVKIWL
ncbi:MAG: hypothetical protein ACE5HS_08240 [bacterium]